jgi:hypothetical protein
MNQIAPNWRNRQLEELYIPLLAHCLTGKLEFHDCLVELARIRRPWAPQLGVPSVFPDDHSTLPPREHDIWWKYVDTIFIPRHQAIKDLITEKDFLIDGPMPESWKEFLSYQKAFAEIHAQWRWEGTPYRSIGRNWPREFDRDVASKFIHLSMGL